MERTFNAQYCLQDGVFKTVKLTRQCLCSAQCYATRRVCNNSLLDIKAMSALYASVIQTLVAIGPFEHTAERAGAARYLKRNFKKQRQTFCSTPSYIHKSEFSSSAQASLQVYTSRNWRFLSRLPKIISKLVFYKTIKRSWGITKFLSFICICVNKSVQNFFQFVRGQICKRCFQLIPYATHYKFLTMFRST